MFDIFTDNPVLILIIIFVIVRLLRGNKGKQPDAPAVRQQRREAVKGAARATRLGDLKAALEDAMREADRQFSSGNQPAPSDAGTAPAPSPALPASAPTADPYAFHSLMNREEQALVDTSRTDYDTTAVDYDTRSDAFAFRPSSDEPVEQEYHLAGFQGFKSAGGLATDPVRVKAVGEDVRVEGEQADPLHDALADPDQLRRAFIIHEILQGPVALRHR